MITDAQLQLSAAQALTSGTAVSTNTIDLGVARDVGAGQPLQLVITVDTTFAGGTSMTPQVIISASSNLSSPVILASGTRALLEAELVAGAIFKFPLPPVNPQGRGLRYLGVQYVNSGTHSAGAVTTNLVLDAQDTGKQYGSGFSVT